MYKLGRFRPQITGNRRKMTHTMSNYTESQKKIKGVKGLAQEAQPSDLYPYARKSDTWVQKKSSKNSKKQFSLFKKFNQDMEKSWSY